MMQHEDNPTKFAIVERFMHKDSSQEEHLSNPYWKVSLANNACPSLGRCTERAPMAQLFRSSTRPSSRGSLSRSRSSATTSCRLRRRQRNSVHPHMHNRFSSPDLMLKCSPASTAWRMPVSAWKLKLAAPRLDSSLLNAP